MNAPSKDSLRRHARALRAALSPEAHAAASAALVARLDALPELRAARTVHSFWPAPDRGEPDLRALLQRLHARGVTVVLPRVVPGAAHALAHHVWDGHAPAPGAFGLPEPAADAPTAPLQALDVVLVPALAADRHGHRLGYGKGYYDRFLPATRAVTILPLFDAALVDALAPEPHDVPVDLVVTDVQTLRISARARAAA